jgi:hypothetical protein
MVTGLGRWIMGKFGIGDRVTQRLGSLEVGEWRDYVGQGIARSRRGLRGWDVKQQVDLSMGHNHAPSSELC